MRASRLIPLLTVILTGCAALGPGGPRAGSGRVLLLGSSQGVVSVDPVDGSVVFEGSGVPSSGDWATLFRATLDGGGTILEARDSATGEALSSVRVPGDLSVRVVSSDGSRVALMPPLAPGASPWIPEPRVSTTITVADPSGIDEPERFHLRGNLEPEAFSADGNTLFLIRYLPPTSPEAYRVAALDLDDGSVSPVATGPKDIVETMSGTRLEQIASADGEMLYTLYTTQPAEYAELRHHAGRPVAFVHTLSLDEGWAHCVGLPRELWGGDPTDQAMAVSPDGARLYVVDTARDVLAVMDTEKLTSESFELGLPSANTPTRAAVGEDGTLFVAAGTEMVAIDPATPEITATWATGAAVTVLGTLPDGLGVAMADRITVIEPATGKHLRTIPSPTVEDPAYLGLLSR